MSLQGLIALSSHLLPNANACVAICRFSALLNQRNTLETKRTPVTANGNQRQIICSPRLAIRERRRDLSSHIYSFRHHGAGSKTEEASETPVVAIGSNGLTKGYALEHKRITTTSKTESMSLGYQGLTQDLMI